MSSLQIQVKVVKIEKDKLKHACSYSGLDSGVKLDMSSDVGTKKRKTVRQREEEKVRRAVNLDDKP